MFLPARSRRGCDEVERKAVGEVEGRFVSGLVDGMVVVVWVVVGIGFWVRVFVGGVSWHANYDVSLWKRS